MNNKHDFVLHHFDSPQFSKVGSDMVTFRFGSRCWEYDFGKNTVTQIKE